MKWHYDFILFVRIFFIHHSINVIFKHLYHAWLTIFYQFDKG